LKPRRLVKTIIDPHVMRTLNGALAIFFVMQAVLAYQLGWWGEVSYVTALSIWALVASHWAGWQAGQVEVRQKEDADVQEVLDAIKDLYSKIVE